MGEMYIFWVKVVVGIVLGLYVFEWFLRHSIIPYFAKKKSMVWLDSKEKDRAHQIFKMLFSNKVEQHLTSRLNNILKKQDISYTYGEIEFVAFGLLLEKANPAPEDTMIDLGSGTGKAVFAASLLYPTLHVTGIELASHLYQFSLKQLDKFKSLMKDDDPAIILVKGDMLTVDLSAYNIVFANATCFSPELFAGLLNCLGDMPVGARLIITTKEVVREDFAEIYHEVLVMSWGKCHCRVYEKIA